MSFRTETKEVIKELHEELEGSIYCFPFIIVGLLVFLGYVIKWTFPWGIIIAIVTGAALYGIYKAIKWAEKEDRRPDPYESLKKLSMDEAHEIAMKEDPSYKEENDTFWGQIADETEKVHGDREFQKGPLERVKELQENS